MESKHKMQQQKISQNFEPKIHDRINERTFFAFILFDTLLKCICRTQSVLRYPHSHEWLKKKSQTVFVCVWIISRKIDCWTRKNRNSVNRTIKNKPKSKKTTTTTTHLLFILIILLKHQIKLLNKISFDHICCSSIVPLEIFASAKIRTETHTDTFWSWTKRFSHTLNQ